MDPFCAALSLQPSDHLLGKGYPLGSNLCDVYFCLCHFPVY